MSASDLKSKIHTKKVSLTFKVVDGILAWLLKAKGSASKVALG